MTCLRSEVFVTLKNCLERDGIASPNFPQKRIFSSDSAEVVDLRRERLTCFLQDVVLKNLWHEAAAEFINLADHKHSSKETSPDEPNTQSCVSPTMKSQASPNISNMHASSLEADTIKSEPVLKNQRKSWGNCPCAPADEDQFVGLAFSSPPALAARTMAMRSQTMDCADTLVDALNNSAPSQLRLPPIPDHVAAEAETTGMLRAQLAEERAVSKQLRLELDDLRAARETDSREVEAQMTCLRSEVFEARTASNAASVGWKMAESEIERMSLEIKRLNQCLTKATCFLRSPRSEDSRRLTTLA